MSNMQEMFYRWQEKMSQKSEMDKHNFALTTAIFVGCVALFFVISYWYYRIYGGNPQTSYFTELEQIFHEQKDNVVNIYSKF